MPHDTFRQQLQNYPPSTRALARGQVDFYNDLPCPPRFSTWGAAMEHFASAAFAQAGCRVGPVATASAAKHAPACVYIVTHADGPNAFSRRTLCHSREQFCPGAHSQRRTGHP